MVKKLVEMHSNLDMDARPIAHLVQEASQYSSQVYIEMENKKINAKSLIGMMSLSMKLGKGVSLTVVADGSDEEAAVSGVETFLQSS